MPLLVRWSSRLPLLLRVSPPPPLLRVEPPPRLKEAVALVAPPLRELEEPPREVLDPPLRLAEEPPLREALLPPPLDACPPFLATAVLVALLADAKPRLALPPFDEELLEEEEPLDELLDPLFVDTELLEEDPLELLEAPPFFAAPPFDEEDPPLEEPPLDIMPPLLEEELFVPDLEAPPFDALLEPFDALLEPPFDEAAPLELDFDPPLLLLPLRLEDPPLEDDWLPPRLEANDFDVDLEAPFELPFAADFDPPFAAPLDEDFAPPLDDDFDAPPFEEDLVAPLEPDFVALPPRPEEPPDAAPPRLEEDLVAPFFAAPFDDELPPELLEAPFFAAAFLVDVAMLLVLFNGLIKFSV